MNGNQGGKLFGILPVIGALVVLIGFLVKKVRDGIKRLSRRKEEQE